MNPNGYNTWGEIWEAATQDANSDEMGFCEAIEAGATLLLTREFCREFADGCRWCRPWEIAPNAPMTAPNLWLIEHYREIVSDFEAWKDYNFGPCHH